MPLWSSASSKAQLVRDLNPFVEQADRGAALAYQLSNALFHSEGGPLKESLEAKIAEIRQERSKLNPQAVFLIFEGTTQAEAINLSSARETDDFLVAFDLIDKEVIRGAFQKELQSCLAATLLAFGDKVDKRISAVTSVVYLFDNERNKPVFSYTMTGGRVRLGIGRGFGAEVMQESRAYVDVLLGDSSLSKVCDLFLQSVNQSRDEFREFLSAWNALEIFIQSQFRVTYGPAWTENLRASVAKSARTYFDRIDEVMKDKYRLIDKFSVIATILCPAEAEGDIRLLKQLKVTRDGISHGSDQSNHFPAEETQRLLTKYLRLHLQEGRP